MADAVHQKDIKGENINRAVQGITRLRAKLKQVAAQFSSSAWTETYYRETAGEIDIGDAGTGIAIQGTPRLAAFPYLQETWSKVSGRHEKFAGEGMISMEDTLTDAIDVQARTIERVGRAIANKVDLNIYTVLTAATSTSGVVAAGDTWDSATLANRDALGDITIGIAAMEANNIDVSGSGFLLLTPKDYGNLIRQTDIVNNPSFKTADVVTNGRVGQILGLNIIVSNNVTTDEAMIVARGAVSWRSAQSQRTEVIVDPGIKITIRSWEIGHLQTVQPLGLYTITNTQL